jgi:hypothetical protein
VRSFADLIELEFSITNLYKRLDFQPVIHQSEQALTTQRDEEHLVFLFEFLPSVNSVAISRNNPNSTTSLTICGYEKLLALLHHAAAVNF